MVEINGEIVPNDFDWIYKFFGIEHTSVNTIKNAVKNLADGEELTVRINSPGGDVASGQEIYSLLRSCNSRAEIMGFAASAAGLAAMGCRRVEMSPVSTIMVHNVWTQTSGDYHEMDKASEMLKNLNKTIAAAYTTKSGRPEAEILEMMDRETWLTAAQAIEMGICDGYIGEAKAEPGAYKNSFCGLSITPEMVEEAKKAKARQEHEKTARADEIAGITGDLYQYGSTY